jgi:hypothetical protein
MWCTTLHLLYLSWHELLQKKRQILEATPDERIAALEAARADLVLKKNEMERKIHNFVEKKRAKEEGQTEGKWGAGCAEDIDHFERTNEQWLPVVNRDPTGDQLVCRARLIFLRFPSSISWRQLFMPATTFLHAIEPLVGRNPQSSSWDRIWSARIAWTISYLGHMVPTVHVDLQPLAWIHLNKNLTQQ